MHPFRLLFSPRAMMRETRVVDVDRMNDRVLSTAWRLDNFRANPVLLYMHNYDAPIGVVVFTSVLLLGAIWPKTASK